METTERLFTNLNDAQCEAVRHTDGPLLILAGAGSGKTRVLTHRIAYLIEACGVNPYQIMAITFTNKAAREMRERVDSIVGYGAESVWVSTFHSTCVRILRRFIDQLGYERSFTIYDTDDQKTLMREVCKFLNIDTKRIKERALLSAISSAKDELISPEAFQKSAMGDHVQEKYAAAYVEYQKRLHQNNALDFDDLIMKTVELFLSCPQALQYYQNRFRYVMVDEYQDTNTAQFRFISLLASHINEADQVEHNLCVVGDDDQSIYKFRGANIRNILDFELNYPDARVIKLEQNYRSTQTILDAANAVIGNNIGRKQKSLWTQNEAGEPVSLTVFEHDYDEAAAIADEIARTVRDTDCRYQDFAILYRTNAQSRSLEEKLIQKNVPYKIIGGINFYQRREIKDLLAYLRTLNNPSDGVCVKRIINVPKRGIGLTTIDRIQAYADKRSITFYEALLETSYIPDVKGAAATKIEGFVSLMEGLKRQLETEALPLHALMEALLEHTGYIEALKAEDEEDAEDRINNINELISKLAQFEEDAENPSDLSAFLEEIALVADVDNLNADLDAVVLMTLHSAKGLEFPYVYLCGMEDGLFPSTQSIFAENPELELEEERRLCYVGITRAKKHLSLTAASSRMLRGETMSSKPSRFVMEIPRHLLHIQMQTGRRYLSEDSLPDSPIRRAKPDTSGKVPQTGNSFGGTAARNGSFPSHTGKASYNASASQADRVFIPSAYEAAPAPALPPTKQFGSAALGTLPYAVGDQVRHLKFGVGTVTDITRGGRDYEITVDFPAIGKRKMLASFANLKPVSQ